ncbi:MAG TPA: PAS domain S-box protein [Anaerolineales bacterium]|nr:PAS domain S-box protein [Anaerolineales bacterium]
MLSDILHWLRPPVFPEDEDKTRVAMALNAILMIGVGGALFYSVFILSVARSEIKSIAFSLFPILFMAVLWALMRSGKVYLASVLFVSLSWLNITIAAIADGYGIRGTSLYGQVLIVIVAGLIINWRASVVFALLNVASGLIMIYASNEGLLPPRGVIQTEFTIWSANAVFSISAAFVLGITLKSLHNAIQRAFISESHYRMLFEAAPDGILIVDQNNQIIMANSAIYQMTGYSPDDVIRHSPLDFVAPDELTIRPPRPLSELKTAGSNKRERTLIHKDGSRLNVIISSSYMPDGQFQYIIQDITERKSIEAALRTSEEKFAKSFQSSPDAVTISFVDTGKFIEVNEGFCRMSGYTREEALGRSAEELNIWEDVQQRNEMVAILQTNGRVRDFETSLRRKNGEALNCLLTVESVEISGQNCMVVITRDVTERKRMEEELRLSEERYRLVSSVISDYIYSTVRDGDQWHQNWIAGAFERITGYTLTEFNNRGGWLSILHPDDLGIDADAMRKLLNNEDTVAEIRIIRKDQSICWVRSYAHPVWDERQARLVGIYGAVQDITAQKQIEQELLLSEERYRLVSSVISDYTFSNIQNERGEIVLNWVAGAFEQISGYTLEEFNARGGWICTVYPDDLEQDAQDMEALRRNQKVISEIRTIHKNGKIRWMKSYAHPVWDEERQELIGIYGAVQDITDRKQIEQEREKLIKDLEAKNQELEQFTYTVSHDLKAPLITIKGFLGFLGVDARAGDEKRVEADIQRINEATDKMHELLTDLLELSRIGRLMNPPEMILFQSLVAEAIALTEGRLQERGIGLIVKEDLPSVYGDHQRLLEVLQNLIDNAAKFMGDQPTPLIEIGRHSEKYDGFETIYIRDNGIGLAPEFHERIFGLFNRLNPKIDGTGIGLTLVKRIVEFHGGRIWLQSQVGEGTTFYFTLPVGPP